MGIRGELTGSALALTVAGLLLSGIGVLMVYSATHTAVSAFEEGLYIKKLIWVGIGFCVFLIVVMLPMRMHEILSYIYYIMLILLLAGLLFYGRVGGGSMRWYSFGFLHFQPSELGKVIVLFAMARYLSYSKKPSQHFRRLMLTGILVLIPTMLVLRQPDLGTSLVYLVLMLAILYWSGLPPVYLLLIISPVFSMITAFHPISYIVLFAVIILLLIILKPGAFMASAIVVVNLLFGMVTPLLWNRLADYQKSRILIFLNPGNDQQGAGYQIIQSKIAIGSGGLLGKGFLGGTQTNLNYLPVRHTDFVFSVVGEEFGFLGGLAIISLFALIIFLGLRTAVRVRNRFTSFVCVGVVTILFFQTVVNIGMTLGIMPVTGLPLHFVSYGGSSMILSWVLLGLLVNAEMSWQEY